MATLYNWGLGDATRNNVVLSNSISADKARVAQENSQRILDQRNQFALDNEMKKEADLSQPVNTTAMLNSKGLHPEDIKYIENTWEGAGLGKRGPMGEFLIEKRNMPDAMKAMADEPKNQLGLSQIQFQRLQNEHNQLEQDAQGIIEKDQVGFKDDKKYNEIRQRQMMIQKEAKGVSSRIEAAQLALDPKLRETMAASALARQDKKDLQTERLQEQGFQAEQNRLSREAEGERNRQNMLAMKQMNNGRGPTEYQLMNATTTLRKEFNNRPEVKEYNTIMPKIAAIDKALIDANGPNKVAGDQALITLFNKMTDPQSVVRESEYARTPTNLSLINRLKGKIEKISSGGAGLTGADRQAIVNMAHSMQTAYESVFNDVSNEYAGYSRGYGIDPTMIIGDRRKATDSNKPSGGIKVNPSGIVKGW